MAGKHVKFSEEKIAQYIKEGRGQGEGRDYQPWIKPTEISSLGRGHRIAGVKTNRIHHFLSDLEARYYYILLWSDKVVDIREQFPLFPVTDTEAIAEKLAVKHPQYPDTKISTVMTTDFLITVYDGNHLFYEARSIKYSDDLAKPRTEEKRKIEELYWQERGIPFKVVTEDSVSRTKADNIKRVMRHYYTPLLDICSDEQRLEIMKELVATLSVEDRPLNDLTKQLDIRYGLPDGSSLTLFFYLAAHKIIPIHIDVRFLATKKISALVDIHALRRKTITEDELNERYA